MKKENWYIVECKEFETKWMIKHDFIDNGVLHHSACFDIVRDNESCGSGTLSLNDIDVIIEATQEEIEAIKPKESFVDVEIRWGEVVKGDGVMTFCIPPWAETEENISTSPIGQVYRGWCLQSFIHQESSMCSNMPICFGQGSVRHAAEILSKATHARFCKVITNATQY